MRSEGAMHNSYSIASIVSSRRYAVVSQSDEKVHGFEGSKVRVRDIARCLQLVVCSKPETVNLKPTRRGIR